MYNNHQSKDCYPETNVLINHFNIKDQKQLDEVEVSYTIRRMLQLEKDPLNGKFDLNHLKAIHKYIFQDIYPFAGQLRTENMGKDNFWFADARYIAPSSTELFDSLKMENKLSRLPANKLVDRAAFYMGEINVLHPFREGNGRTQREFIRTLLLKNGYSLDWSRVNKEVIMKTSIQSVTDHKPLANVIHDCLLNTEPKPSLKKPFQKKNKDLGLER